MARLYRPTAKQAALALGMGLMGLTAINYAGTRRIAAAIEELMPQEPVPATYETTWTSEGPLEHTVTTTRNVGETAAQHAARHAADVAALKEVFPPV